jgi:hypothetical protein
VGGQLEAAGDVVRRQSEVLQGSDVDAYARTVREGIGRLKAARIDIVLMDPQFAPRVLARPTHAVIVDAIGALANDTKVAVFRRFAVMRHWDRFLVGGDQGLGCRHQPR